MAADTSTTNIHRLAEELVESYGREAEMVALHRSGILQNLQNPTEAEFWWLVSGAVSRLLDGLTRPH